MFEVAAAVKAFAAADIVLTTYNVLQRDLALHRVRSSPLLGVQWWRVMLDEAQVRSHLKCTLSVLIQRLQMVSNAASAAAVMCSELFRYSGWTVTGNRR